MKDFFDPDIAALNMSEVEKNGLQVFRNYSQAFDKHRIKLFVDTTKKQVVSLTALQELCALIVKEDARWIPVISCAYADDALKAMYKREIPTDVPGGRGEMLSGLGPLSALAQRIQVAYAFSWLSEDILEELNHLRNVRNEISHKWDAEALKTKLDALIRERQHPIEEFLGDGVRLPEGFHQSLSFVQRFRVRALWLVGRLTYETQYWVPALKARLDPHAALYGEQRPALLGGISEICVEATKAVCANDG